MKEIRITFKMVVRIFLYDKKIKFTKTHFILSVNLL